MLPLVGQKLALAHKGEETALMSACVIAAQLVMLPMPLLVSVKALGTQADLPRGIRNPADPRRLYTLSDDRFWLVAVQLLDGVGAGIFGARWFPDAQTAFSNNRPRGEALPRSIIGWFVVCWAAFLVASVVVGALLLSLYGQSTTE
jgi:hypothetical protein